jgi:hypothetical protein
LKLLLFNNLEKELPVEDNESNGIPIPPKQNPTNPNADVGIEVSNAEFIAAVFAKLANGAVVAFCPSQ